MLRNREQNMACKITISSMIKMFFKNNTYIPSSQKWLVLSETAS